jgi:MFS family permease
VGQTISRLGDSLYRIALAWWVLEATGSATAMGTVLIFTSAPMLIFLLFGGVAVDRFSRTRVMLASDLGRGVVVGIVALLAFGQRLELWHIYVAGIVFGFVDAFFQPAFTALVPEVTPAAALTSANSLTSLSERLAGIVGPALGAVIVGVSGTSTAFLLDGITFFLSAICLIPILTLSTRAVKGRTSMLKDLSEGINTVRYLPWLWITIVIASVSNITVGSVAAVAMPFLVKDHLQTDVNTLGWIYSTISIGSVLAAIWLGQRQKISHRGWTIYLSLIVTGTGILIFGLSTNLIGTLGAAFISGCSLSIIGLVWLNTLQEQIPRNQLGRVASIDMLGSFVLMPVGYGIIGWMTDLMGAASIFILGGVVTVCLALVGLTHPAIRALD